MTWWTMAILTRLMISPRDDTRSGADPGDYKVFHFEEYMGIKTSVAVIVQSPTGHFELSNSI